MHLSHLRFLCNGRGTQQVNKRPSIPRRLVSRMCFQTLRFTMLCFGQTAAGAPREALRLASALHRTREGNEGWAKWGMATVTRRSADA